MAEGVGPDQGNSDGGDDAMRQSNDLLVVAEELGQGVGAQEETDAQQAAKP